MRCPQCNHEHPIDAEFCGNCGCDLNMMRSSKSKAVTYILGAVFVGLVSLVDYLIQSGSGIYIITGLTALIFGALAIAEIRRNPCAGMAAVGRSFTIFTTTLAVLALAGAIFFPLLCRHGSPAMKSICQTNLKELGTAVIMYVNDNNGTLPSSKLYGNSDKWNAKDFVGFAKATVPPSENSRKSYPVLIKKYLKDTSVFSCPSDSNYDEKGVVSCSYYWKAAVDVAWFEGYRESSDFKYPGEQILLYEHNGWHWGDVSKGLTDGVSINAVFLDGHVATKRIQNSGYTIEENPPGPLPKSGVGEPAWYNKSDKPNFKLETGKFFDPKHYYDDLQ